MSPEMDKKIEDQDDSHVYLLNNKTNQNRHVVEEKKDDSENENSKMINDQNIKNMKNSENMLQMDEITKRCANSDPCGKRFEGRVLIGPRGEVLTREDTVVAGCTACTGGRIVSCAKVKCTSSLCWQRTSKKPSIAMLSWLTFFTTLSFIGTIIFCFTNLFTTTILSNLIIRNNTPAYAIWKNPPVYPMYKIHIFNYTNAEEVMNGVEKKLKVKDVGPYTYSEMRTRVNEVFNKNGTISYQEKRAYKFIPELSVGVQFDKLYVPNLPLLSAMYMARNSYVFTQMGLATLFRSLKAKAFRNLPMHRFLWGYDDDLVTLARPILQLRGDPVFDKFGILVAKNGTSPDIYTVNTGENDLDSINIITRINGIDKMDHWGTNECNRIDATDGVMFPASTVDRKQTLYVTNKELCRRFPFVYEKDVSLFNDIPAWRYVPPKTVFDYPSVDGVNQCYCDIDSGICPPKGLFNCSPCINGAPAFASFPHFYLGDQELINSIDGMKPDAEKHSSYLDIHPNLGLSLGTIFRTQFNMQYIKSKGISDYDFLPDGIFLPVAWFEVYVTDLPPEIRTLIYHATFSAHQAHLVLMWGCVITFIVSGFILLLAIKARITGESTK